MRTSLVVVCCLTLAACSAEPQPVTSASASAVASASSAPPSASKSETSYPASSAATEPVPTSVQPSASDGTNYEACLGGDCEIAVSKPVTIKLFEDYQTAPVRSRY